MAVYKVNISLPPDLVEKIDEAAEEHGLTRSSFIREASARYLTDLKSLSEAERRQKDIERARQLARRLAVDVGSFDGAGLIRADRDGRQSTTGGGRA